MTETWLPATDGIVTRLTATIAGLLEAGHQVLVICPRPRAGAAPDPRADPRVKVRRVSTFRLRFLYGGQGWGLPDPAVARSLRAFRPDVVHVVNPVLLGIAGVAAARVLRLPLVASFHTDVGAYARFYHLGGLYPVIWFALRVMHNAAGVNLATSTAGAAALRRHGVRAVALWPRGVDLDRFHPPSDVGQAHPPAGPGRGSRITALYVGRVAAEKGLRRLAPLSQPGSGCDLVVVGEGPGLARLRDALGGRARFTGLLHGDDLARAYRDADVFVFPSTTDTLGLVVLEALASGLPVVAADSPASRGLLAGCAAARLVPPDDPDALARAVSELGRRHRTDASLARTARAFAGASGWGEATSFLIERYGDAIRCRNTARGTVPPRPGPAGPTG